MKNLKCNRCSTPINDAGFCQDETCPFSDHKQDCQGGWSGHPEYDCCNDELPNIVCFCKHERPANSLKRLVGTALRESGWAGWAGGILLRNPGGMTDEQLVLACAVKAEELKRSVAVRAPTEKNFRLLGAGYTPKGYKNSQFGPHCWKIEIIGDPIPKH